jgi:prepilin-type N-terminal cleavage/methylation domain-containing protein
VNPQEISQMLKNRSSRPGFTLPEVLVTVAIVAVLAAIVVPTVTNQISKGDDTNIVTNVVDQRTAITAFISDVRKFPSRLQNMVLTPAAADLDLFGAAFGAGPVAKWRGPYLATSMKAIGAAGVKSDSIFIGLAFAVDSLCDTLFAAPNKGMLGLKLGGVTSTAVALHIDSLLDGGTGIAAGNLQWVGAPPTNGRLTLILMGR